LIIARLLLLLDFCNVAIDFVEFTLAHLIVILHGFLNNGITNVKFDMKMTYDFLFQVLGFFGQMHQLVFKVSQIVRCASD
jgi:hypothetical protein